MTGVAEKRAAYREAAKKQLLARRADLVDLFRNCWPSASDAQLWQEADYAVISSGFAGANNLPRARESSKAQATKEIARLRHLSRSLAVHIRGMHRTALAALEAQIGIEHPLDIADQAAALAVASKNAAARIGGQTETPGIGAPAKRASRQRTEIAADIFKRISGHEPKGKAFTTFVARFFAIIGEGASPEGQLKLRKKGIANR